MKINKFLALLLILAIPVSLSACGKSADFTTNDDKSSHWYNMECGCGKFVPEPQKEYKLLQYSDFLSAEVPNVSEKEFEEYVKAA